MLDNQIYAFDWDGTLADSTGRIVFAFYEAFNELNTEPPSEQAILNIIGLALPVAIATLLPDANPRFQQRLAEAYHRHYFKIDEPVTLYAGARQLLEELNEAGHFVTVATGKSVRGLKQAIKQTQTGDLLHYTQTAEQTRSKPDPMMLNNIADFCGVEVTRLVMIGDTDFDIQMGHNAGCRTIAISHGAHKLERLRQIAPERIVADLPTLGDYLRATVDEQSKSAV